MFDIGFGELLVCAIIALLVLGPERLPGAVRTVGRWVGRARHTVNNFTDQIDREIRAEDMKRRIEEEMKKLGVDDVARQVHDALHAPLPPPIIGAGHLRGDSDDTLAGESGQSAGRDAVHVKENSIAPPAIAAPSAAHVASPDATPVGQESATPVQPDQKDITTGIVAAHPASADEPNTIPASARADKST